MLVVAPMVSQSPPPVPCHAPPQTLPRPAPVKAESGCLTVPPGVEPSGFARIAPFRAVCPVFDALCQPEAKTRAYRGLYISPYYPLLSMHPLDDGGPTPNQTGGSATQMRTGRRSAGGNNADPGDCHLRPKGGSAKAVVR